MENLDAKSSGYISRNYELATAGDRFIAALVDWIGMAIVLVVPIIGPLVCLAYALTKDALPFLDGQSLGKKVMKIKVVDEATGEPIIEKYDKSVLRAISLLIPVFNIIDAFMVFSDNRKRFGDQWAKTVVVKWPDEYNR